MATPKRRPARIDHVVWDMSKTTVVWMRCHHCGDSYELPLPCSIGIVVAVNKQYIKQHRRCRPQKPASDISMTMMTVRPRKAKR